MVLCNAAPHHASSTFLLYGLGLGVNSMEPREQKHQRIKKYAENTTPQNKWPMTFTHEFMSSIYLRERGFDTIKYHPRVNRYIPDECNGSCHKCGLKLRDNDLCCLLCDDREYSNLVNSLDLIV